MGLRLGTAALVALVALVVTGAAGGDTDRTPLTCDGHDVRFHLDRTGKVLKKGYAKSRVEDPSPLKSNEKEAVKNHKFCLKRSEDRARVEHQRDKFQGKLDEYFRQTYTPNAGPGDTWWAIPYYIVSCESGGNFQAYSYAFQGGGAYGILDSEWVRYGGHELSGAWRADQAKPFYQHIIATRIRNDVGITAHSWECS